MTSILSKISCLVTLVETDNDDEVPLLIDMINDVKIERKHLLLMVSNLSKTILKNKTINYNVGMYQKDKGTKSEIFNPSVK